MPWPDFSELTFGFGFLREFEKQFCGGTGFPSAPTFISQADEASLGYDVEASYADHTPVFFQFKRSFVVKSGQAAEYKSRVKDKLAPHPFYRMNLRKKDAYRQHQLLRELALDDNEVFYVTSQVDSPEALNVAFRDERVVEDAAALFAPTDIPLPADDEQHFVSFRADADIGYLFSRQPEEFRRSLPSMRTLFSEVVPDRQLDPRERRERLTRFNKRLQKENIVASRVAKRFESPLIRASILAFMVLDAHMVLLPNFTKQPAS